ncbi:MAG: hypothetical protein KC425_19335, partial [Anaerolineales bacterium]|nr:hypothetical protein [Anaerolineales bacterium]
DTGCYGRLQLLTADLPAYLAARVGERLGAAVDVALYHDGMAAALAYAGAGETAVITLGTAIGNGFPPPAAGLHALSEMNHG